MRLIVMHLWLIFALSACSSVSYVQSDLAKPPQGRLLAEAVGPKPKATESQVTVRYLRAGGVYFEWQGQALLTAPFASNYPVVDLSDATVLSNTKLRIDTAAVDHVMHGQLKHGAISAVLVGHSHYDHLGDVPYIAKRWTPNATVYVNQTGENILASVPSLRKRVVSIEGRPRWVRPPLSPLIRFYAILSEHAPNLSVAGQGYWWAPGEVKAAWKPPFEGHPLIEMQSGKTFAFLIDFMDPKEPSRVAFRVHYQDAASSAPKGYPAAALLKERDVDLAIVTLPGYEAYRDAAQPYPTALLRHVHAHHALVIHYEDFFRPVVTRESAREVRLLETLRGTMDEFSRLVDAGIAEPRPGPCDVGTEGLCGESFTLPLPGEWLLFDAAPRKLD